MLGPLLMLVTLATLPRVAAVLVAGFLLIYGVKISLEELRDPDVPDRRKALIALVLGASLHVLVFHPELLAWAHR